MHIGTGRLTGDPLRGSVCGGASSIDTGGELPCDVWSTGPLLMHPLTKQAPDDILGAHANGHRHTGGTQTGRTSGRDRVGISDRVNDGRDAGGQECVDTGRGAALMVTRLQSHHGRTACCLFPRGPQGDHLRVLTTGWFGGTHPDDLAGCAQDHRSHRRIRVGRPLHPLPLLDRQPHRSGYLCLCGHSSRCGEASPAWRRSASTAAPGSAAP